MPDVRLRPPLEMLKGHTGTDPERDAFAGAVVAVSGGGRPVVMEALGTTTIDPGSPPMSVDAVFDAASVTKVVVTTTAVLQLVERGLVTLDDRVDRFLPGLVGAPIGQATLVQLLTHTSGLPYVPLFALGADWSEWLEEIAEMPLVGPGERVIYSCPGFILLGRIVETVTGEGLAEYAERRILDPLGLDSSRYLPLSAPVPGSLAPRLVMTERRDASVRGRVIDRVMRDRDRYREAWAGRHQDGFALGCVHDENAAALGGVAGNAGLFTTAADLVAFGRMWLDQGAAGVLTAATIQTATRDRTGEPERRGLGWLLGGPGSPFGDLTPTDAYGHTGFTGQLLFIDPHRGLVAVLLTNRLQFGRANERILRVRRLFLDMLMAAFDPRGGRVGSDA